MKIANSERKNKYLLNCFNKQARNKEKYKLKDKQASRARQMFEKSAPIGHWTWLPLGQKKGN